MRRHWDGNGTFDETASGASGAVQLSHAFSTAGTLNVGVRATDKDGGQRTTFTYAVHVWSLSPSGDDLVWEGSDGNDTVEFVQTGPDSVEVRTLQVGGFTTNFVDSFTGVTGRVIGRGNAGYDILSGANSNDSLTGGTGLDLLIGGIGLDTLKGEGGEDLLVADKTNFDLNAAALLAIHNEWTSASSYADRVLHLTGTPGGLNGGTFLTPGTTVYDDEVIDSLAGGLDLDWYIYSLLEPEDLLNDHQPGETETDTAGFVLP